MPKRYNDRYSGSEANRKLQRDPATGSRSDASSAYHRDIGGGRTLSVSQEYRNGARHVYLNINQPSRSKGKGPSTSDHRENTLRNKSPAMSRRQPGYDRYPTRASRKQPEYVSRGSHYDAPPSDYYGCYNHAPPAPSHGYPLRHQSRNYYHDDVVSSEDDLAHVYNAPSASSMMDIVNVTAKVRRSRSRGFGIPVLKWEGYNGRIDVTAPCADNARHDLIHAIKLYKQSTGLKVREGDILSMAFKRNYHKVPSRQGHTTIVEAFQPLWNLTLTHANPERF